MEDAEMNVGERLPLHPYGTFKGKIPAIFTHVVVEGMSLLRRTSAVVYILWFLERESILPSRCEILL